MMTIEKLAKHWGVSLKEAQSISDFMNNTFYMTTGQKRGDESFYGLIYEKFKDGAVRLAFSLSADSKHGFKTEKEAIEALNKAPHRIKIPDGRAKLMGVPQDAFIALKRIEQPSILATRKQISPVIMERGGRG